MEPGKLEFQYTLNTRGRELGLTQAQLSDAVRTGFLGLEVVHVTSENQRLPVSWQLLDDSTNIGKESFIKHMVSFVQHKYFH